MAVLGEKPMATNLDEARDLVRMSERTSALFVVSQNRRYNAGLEAFRLLAADRLGGIGHLNAEFYLPLTLASFREEMDSPLLIDMAIHTFDAARHVTGADPGECPVHRVQPTLELVPGRGLGRGGVRAHLADPVQL